MKRCVACGKEYPDISSSCSDCGISLGAPIKVEDMKYTGDTGDKRNRITSEPLGDGHFLAVASLIALLIWCFFCATWWCKTEEYYWVDAPEILPVIGPPGIMNFFGFLTFLLVIYILVSLVSLIMRKKNAQIMAKISYPFMTTIHIMMMVSDWWMEQKGEIRVHEYNGTLFLLITAAIYGIGLLCNHYYKDKDEYFCN